MKSSLIAIDEEIRDSITNVRRQGSSMAGSESGLSGILYKFRVHIANDLMTNKRHLYYHYNKHTKDRRSLLRRL